VYIPPVSLDGEYNTTSEAYRKYLLMNNPVSSKLSGTISMPTYPRNNDQGII
jgi:hypothetical protein